MCGTEAAPPLDDVADTCGGARQGCSCYRQYNHAVAGIGTAAIIGVLQMVTGVTPARRRQAVQNGTLLLFWAHWRSWWFNCVTRRMGSGFFFGWGVSLFNVDSG
jgi:hypothetical protein